jgi:hypothetical protein
VPQWPPSPSASNATGSYAVPFCAAAIFQLAASGIVLAGREVLNPARINILRNSDAELREP